MSRSLSGASVKAFDSIEGIGYKLHALESQYEKAKNNPASTPFVYHQFQSEIDKIQSEVDSILTADILSGKAQVQKKRKLLTLRCSNLETDIAIRLDKLVHETKPVRHETLHRKRSNNGIGNEDYERAPSTESREINDNPQLMVQEFVCSCIDYTSVTLMWRHTQSATRYEVVAREEGDDGDWKCVHSNHELKENTVEVKHLKPGMQYRFKCRAIQDQNGKETLCGMWELLRGIKLKSIILYAPQNLRSIAKSHNSCTLQWDVSSNYTANLASFTPSYELEFRMLNTSVWIISSHAIHQLACKKKNLSHATSYEFRVRAALPNSPWGPWSNTTVVKTSELDQTIQIVRRKAKSRLYAEHGLSDPLPLPSPSTPHFPAPKFDFKVPAPCRCLQDSYLSSVDNRRLALKLRRSRLLEDTFEAMVGTDAKAWTRSFFICFEGESGSDYGALTRDWILKLLDTMTFPDFGLFTQVGSACAAHPSPTSVVQSNFLEYFRIFGRALAKAFLENMVVGVRLSNLLLKSLLNMQAGALEDLEHFDGDLHRSLKWMLENDISGITEETFSADISILGEVLNVDLIPNGSLIPVTEGNKENFVNLKARAAMLHGIKDQMEAIRHGFSELVPPSLLKEFSVADLQLALSGVSNISVLEWRQHTLSVPSEPEHEKSHKRVVDMFWQILAEMRPDEKSKVLNFATASAAPPPGGFEYLRPNKFRIVTEVPSIPGALPSAHACFCTLVLPLDIADDYDDFRHKLILAITETEGFGMV